MALSNFRRFSGGFRIFPSALVCAHKSCRFLRQRRTSFAGGYVEERLSVKRGRGLVGAEAYD